MWIPNFFSMEILNTMDCFPAQGQHRRQWQRPEGKLDFPEVACDLEQTAGFRQDEHSDADYLMTGGSINHDRLGQQNALFSDVDLNDKTGVCLSLLARVRCQPFLFMSFLFFLRARCSMPTVGRMVGIVSSFLPKRFNIKLLATTPTSFLYSISGNACARHRGLLSARWGLRVRRPICFIGVLSGVWPVSLFTSTLLTLSATGCTRANAQPEPAPRRAGGSQSPGHCWVHAFAMLFPPSVQWGSPCTPSYENESRSTLSVQIFILCVPVSSCFFWKRLPFFVVR